MYNFSFISEKALKKLNIKLYHFFAYVETINMTAEMVTIYYLVAASKP